MKTHTSLQRLMITAILGISLSGVSTYSAAGGAKAVPEARPESPARATVSGVTAALNNTAVTEWNLQAVSILLSQVPAIPPARQTRHMAIVQTAVHDAVNGITGDYATYLPASLPPGGASPEAAAIAAAHHALRNLFSSPAQIAALDLAFAASLASHGLSEVDPGIAFGRAAAANILAARANDLSAQAQFDYTVPGAGQPGVWIRLNNAPALLPGWGAVTPWVLNSGSQFRPDPPPALDSEQYTSDYNEIKEIGALNSPTRTTLQTQIAQFWLGSPVAIWNPALLQALAARDFDLSQTARAFALFYLAAADASIACWEAKYHYNFWRPQLAIRGGDTDGNGLTAADPGWLPQVMTPPHPEYPSGHTANSGAMAAVLRLLFGDEPGVEIEVTIGSITRRWSSFSEGVDEVIDGRVYSGFHFRTSDEVGARLGRQVGRYVMTHALKRCRKGNCRRP